MSSWNKDLLLVKGGMNEFIPRYKKWDDPGTWVKIPFSKPTGLGFNPISTPTKDHGNFKVPLPNATFPPEGNSRP